MNVQLKVAGVRTASLARSANDLSPVVSKEHEHYLPDYFSDLLHNRKLRCKRSHCVHFIAMDNNCQFTYDTFRARAPNRNGKEKELLCRKSKLAAAARIAKPARSMRRHLCKGCKIGYDTGERDIAKAKCAMKVCCVRRGLGELRGLRGISIVRNACGVLRTRKL